MKKAAFERLFSFLFYLYLIHEQPRGIAKSTVVFRQVVAPNHDFNIPSRDRFKVQLIGEYAIPIGPSGNRDFFLRHLAEVLSIIGNQHLDLAGVVDPCAFIGKRKKTDMMHLNSLLHVDDSINRIAAKTQPTPRIIRSPT